MKKTNSKKEEHWIVNMLCYNWSKIITLHYGSWHELFFEHHDVSLKTEEIIKNVTIFNQIQSRQWNLKRFNKKYHILIE